MNLHQIYIVLSEIGEVSTTNVKEALIGGYLVDPNFAEVCRLACEPSLRFHHIPTLDRPGTGRVDNPEQVFSLCQRLSSREITGKDAQNAVNNAYQMLSHRGGIVLSRILRKDLRIGATANTLNRVKRGFVSEFKVMLAHKYEEHRIRSWPVAVQPKYDGFRCIVHIDEDRTIRFLSRTGKEDFASFPVIERELRGYDDLVNVYIDAEIKVGSFNNTASQVRKKDGVVEDAMLMVFDVLTPEEFFGIDLTTHATRRARLEALRWFGAIYNTPEWLAHSHDEVLALYQQCRDNGDEGIIVKPLDGYYEPKRSYAWMKIKEQQSIDVQITGAFEGDGKYVGSLGGLIVDVDGVQVRVGGGFSDALRQELWRDWHSDVGNSMYGEDPAVWPTKLLGKLIEVEFHEKTPDGSLRHPRFVRFRDDKNEVNTNG